MNKDRVHDHDTVPTDAVTRNDIVHNGPINGSITRPAPDPLGEFGLLLQLYIPLLEKNMSQQAIRRLLAEAVINDLLPVLPAQRMPLAPLAPLAPCSSGPDLDDGGDSAPWLGWFVAPLTALRRQYEPLILLRTLSELLDDVLDARTHWTQQRAHNR